MPHFRHIADLAEIEFGRSFESMLDTAKRDMLPIMNDPTTSDLGAVNELDKKFTKE